MSGSLKVAWPDAQARLSPPRETVSQEHGLDLLPDLWQFLPCQPRVTIGDRVGAPGVPGAIPRESVSRHAVASR